MLSWDQIEAQIPEYRAFLTVDELNARTKELSSRYPGVVEQSIIGKSRSGEAIYCLKIGRGSKRAVWFGCPHPNEPIGTLTIDFWAEFLAKNDALRDELDWTFFLVKCIDPDGTRLNEGWFQGPFDAYTYASNFYRPAGKDQVEWTFPIQYKTLHFDSPLPETQALMNLIDEAKPHFLYALHNAGLGGAYFYINRPLPALYPQLHRVIENLNIPLSQGEPEVPWAKKYAKAIYQLITTAESYDYYAQFAQVDPAAMVLAGASSAEYAAKYGTLCLVPELPYFYHPAIDDTTPTDAMRTETLSASIKMQQEMLDFLAPRYEKVKEYQDSPFAAALKEYVEKTPQRLQAQRAWVETLKEHDRPATTAEAFETVIMRFYAMLHYGMLTRHCRWCADQNPSRQGEYLQLAEETDRELRRLAAQLEREHPYEVIPIKKLVSAQLASGFHTLFQL